MMEPLSAYYLGVSNIIQDAYYFKLSDDIYIISRQYKTVNINQEIELQRIKSRLPPENSVTTISNNLLEILPSVGETLSGEKAIKKKLMYLGYVKKDVRDLQYEGIHGKADLITVNGEVAEIKSTFARRANKLILKGIVEATLYGTLGILSGKLHYPRLYVAVGYLDHDTTKIDNAETHEVDYTAILKKIDIHEVRINIRDLEVPNNVMTEYKAERIFNCITRGA